MLRAAVREDAAALGELMLLADLAHYAESGYALSLGGDRAHQVAQLTRLACVEARSGFHYSHFEVAEVDDSVVAAVAGFERALAGEQTGAALVEIGWEAAEIEKLAERLGPIGECFPEEEPGTWTIEHVATLPGYRGFGLGRRLLERVLTRGAAQGFRVAVVDVFAGNERGLGLYRGAGFEEAGRFGGEAMRRVLGRDELIRLRRPLTGLIQS